MTSNANIDNFPALKQAVNTLNKNHPGGFISIKKYVATSKRVSPEVSDVTINGHVNYRSILEKSLEVGSTIDAQIVAKKASVDVDTARQAMKEQMASLQKSLDNFVEEDPDETHYQLLGAGAKLHRESGVLHVSGLLVNKIIREPGPMKPVKSKAKTLAKNTFRRMLPIGRWRQFRLADNSFERVAVAGQVIEGAA